MEYYNWIKVFHYASFISWMAGLFYLPRLFVYHVEHYDNKDFVNVVKIQEHKLFYYITQPAMIASVLSGVAMIVLNKDLFTLGYFHAKLTFALLLVVFHCVMWFYLKQLKNDKCNKSGKFFRINNEVPTLIMIGILIFMIIKPF